MIPLVRTPRELAEFFAGRWPIAAHELSATRRMVEERPLAYPLGAGQADVVAVAAGIKPMLRHTLRRAEVEAALRGVAHLGLESLVVDTPPNSMTHHGEVRLYLGREAWRVRHAAQAEQALDDQELGRLLGYPYCCVTQFLEAPQPRSCASVVQAHFAGAPWPGSARLNCVDLRVFHYVSWVPCSPHCTLSRRYADAVREQIASPFVQFVTQSRAGVGFEAFAREVDRALSAHRLHVFPGVQVSLVGATDGEGVQVSHAWATARDRHPGFPADAAETEATARLMRRLDGVRRVRVRGQALVLDEEIVVRAPQLFLVRFAGT